MNSFLTTANPGIALFLFAKAEELRMIANSKYSTGTGLPIDKAYLEKGLPAYLQRSLDAMKESWKIEDSGATDPHWDCFWCELNADINSAEVDHLISHEQAAYLRSEYLRMGNSA